MKESGGGKDNVIRLEFPGSGSSETEDISESDVRKTSSEVFHHSVVMPIFRRLCERYHRLGVRPQTIAVASRYVKDLEITSSSSDDSSSQRLYAAPASLAPHVLTLVARPARFGRKNWSRVLAFNMDGLNTTAAEIQTSFCAVVPHEPFTEPQLFSLSVERALAEQSLLLLSESMFVDAYFQGRYREDFNGQSPAIQGYNYIAQNSDILDPIPGMDQHPSRLAETETARMMAGIGYIQLAERLQAYGLVVDLDESDRMIRHTISRHRQAVQHRAGSSARQLGLAYPHNQQAITAKIIQAQSFNFAVPHNK